MATKEELIQFLEEDKEMFRLITLPWEIPDFPEGRGWDMVKRTMAKSNEPRPDIIKKIQYCDEIIEILKTYNTVE